MPKWLNDTSAWMTMWEDLALTRDMNDQCGKKGEGVRLFEQRVAGAVLVYQLELQINHSKLRLHTQEQGECTTYKP